MTPTARAEAIRLRSYARPLDTGLLETWPQTVDRVMSHQEWLWSRAKNAPLNDYEKTELKELRQLILNHKMFPAGRILWMGGTETIRRRESASINCSFLKIQTIHDVVDAFWLLLQGCGVGFEPVPGILNGFADPLQIHIKRSLGKDRGREHNIETVENGVWTISVGDSAEAWAKAVGKLIASKPPRVKDLVLDFSEVRAAGKRLKGYGWISSGDATISVAFKAIADLLNKRAGKLLTRIDILDVVNHLGTTLSSRRSAQIALMPYQDKEADAFISAKKNWWENGNAHRQMSNNSLLFDSKPTKAELHGIFAMMQDAGGSEPGIINTEAAMRRAPWFAGFNPCLTGDTLIPTNRGFCPIKWLAYGVGEFLIRDGNGNFVEAEARLTGRNQPVYEVEFSDGSIYKATAGHEWVLADGTKCHTLGLCAGDAIKPADITGMFGQAHDPKNAYVAAWLAADGTNINAKGMRLDLHHPKFDHQEELESHGVVFTRDAGNFKSAYISDWRVSKERIDYGVMAGDRETVAAFIRGAMQSDGTVCHTAQGG